MRRRIVRRGHAIPSLADNLSALYHHGPKWAAAPRLDALDRKLNGARHEWITHILIATCFAATRLFEAIFVAEAASKYTAPTAASLVYFWLNLSMTVI